MLPFILFIIYNFGYIHVLNCSHNNTSLLLLFDIFNYRSCLVLPKVVLAMLAVVFQPMGTLETDTSYQVDIVSIRHTLKHHAGVINDIMTRHYHGTECKERMTFYFFCRSQQLNYESKHWREVTQCLARGDPKPDARRLGRNNPEKLARGGQARLDP